MLRGFRIVASLLTCGAIYVAAQPARDDWNDVLKVARIRQVNRDLLKRTPFYTCLETISRATSKNSSAKFKREDIVQVDVGVGEGQEIYSWPGAQAFAQENLPELVGHGLLTTGMFHSFASNLFAYSHGTIHLVGGERLDGHAALHFTYTVPHLESQWDVNWLGVRDRVEQAGDFWVDASNGTLFLLRVRATEIPAVLRLRSMQVSIDYQVVSFEEVPTLLPLSATTTAVDATGKVFEDSAVYSQCHMFATNSRVADSKEELQGALAKFEVHRHTIPPGRTLQMVLNKSLDLQDAKVGDEITAHLERSVKISDSLAIPPGSVARGRVRRLELLEDVPGALSVGIDFHEIVSGTDSFSFLANLTALSPVAGVSRSITSARDTDRHALPGGIGNVQQSTILPEVISGIGFFFVEGRTQLPAGFRMSWTTLNVSEPKVQN